MRYALGVIFQSPGARRGRAPLGQLTTARFANLHADEQQPIRGFLAIHRETLLAYRRIGHMHTGQLPLTGFRDLPLISVAVFFEDSPSRNLWRVDEFLSLRIEPLRERLAAGG